MSEENVIDIITQENTDEEADSCSQNVQPSTSYESSPIKNTTQTRGRGRGRKKSRMLSQPRRISVDKITDDIYAAFVGALEDVSDQVQEIVQAMKDSADYSAEHNVEDDLLGIIPAVILHVPTKRYVLMSEQKTHAIEAAVERFKDEKHVVGSCLRAIQKGYIGFPPVIQLRNQILEIVDKTMKKSIEVPETSSTEESLPLVQSPLPQAHQPGADDLVPEEQQIVVEEPEQLLLQMHDGDIVRVEEVHNDGSVTAYVGGDLRRLYEDDVEEAHAQGMLTVVSRQPTPYRQPGISTGSAIPDSIYDQLAQVLAGRVSLEEISDRNNHNAVKTFVNDGAYYAEFWEESDEILPSGWKIRQRVTQKIVPKRSQCEMICKKWFDGLSATHSASDILRQIDEKYVGVISQAKIKEASRMNLLKGPRVQFPMAALTFGSKPMQYVQVDIVDMEAYTYSDRTYRQALLITDLFSQFIFGRALAENTDSSMIARYLVDIFCGFGPPEGFRSSCVVGTVATLMNEISRMFKVSIKNFGLGLVDHLILIKGMQKERWVEAMPFAIIDYNQKPHRTFDSQISPFEIMFGRRPWKDAQLPPWVRIGGTVSQMDAEEAGGSPAGQRIVVDDEPSTSDFGSPVYLKQTISLHRKIEQISASSTVVQNYGNGLRDPGTGVLFEVGDKVYMRNPMYKDQSRPPVVRNRVCPRYFRAVVAEIDYNHPDYLYRCNYWSEQTDLLDNDQWPDETACSSWVSPFDVTSSSIELNRKRSLFRHKEEQWKCRCGSVCCGLTFNEKCSYKMSLRCCTRINTACPFHRKVQDSVPPKQGTSATKKRRVFGFGPIEKSPAKKPATLYRDMRTILPEDSMWPS
ncbi:hypothetical protein L596_025581 [Steinernema carpocapsae]|uniref:Integrase catalytic domain-containing protein n=1 Tax=Steinernema carpocapsae TaxID=34508 RepID=A0A4U5M864_STECR|nr:hypothetical protein L596_025581 [Steinernema carpocapsae]